MHTAVSLQSGVTLRQATRVDASAIRRLIRQVGINPMSLDWRRFTLAVDADDRMLACAQIKPHGDGTRELASLAVIPQRRGQGLARALILYLQAQAGPPLHLTCRDALEPLYQRYGFRTLSDGELTPYFLRLRRITNLLLLPARGQVSMRIMRWDG